MAFDFQINAAPAALHRQGRGVSLLLVQRHHQGASFSRAESTSAVLLRTVTAPSKRASAIDKRIWKPE